MIKEKTIIDELKLIIQEKVINISDEKIQKFYEYWDRKISDEEFDKKEYVFQKELIKKEQNLPEKTYLLGVDFPKWYGSFTSKRKIMIVGIDPLRTSDYFNYLGANKENDVIIGTPFALDNNDIIGNREHKNSFWHFVSSLAEENFVYVTDIFKTFFYTDEEFKNRSYNYFQKIESTEKQKEALFEEIKVIKPDLIITLGGITFEQLLGKKCPKLTRNIKENVHYLNNELEVVPMVHLTGGWDNTIKNFLNQNKIEIDSKSTRKQYGINYAKIINQHLESRN